MTRRVYHRASVDERRKALIEATHDCIAEFGLHGATVRQIAIRAGVTGGLIRHYFESKEQMVQAAFRETMTGMTAMAVEAVEAAGDDAAERLKAFVRANLSGPVTDSRSLSLWASFISQVRVDPALAVVHREGYLSFRQVIEDLVKDLFAKHNREAGDKETHRLAIAINGLIDGLWLEACLAPDLFADSEIASVALTSVEAMIGLPLNSHS
jgi:TetR/AcrR family transcriptional regulator, transcriptional repressor of bet genes